MAGRPRGRKIVLRLLTNNSRERPGKPSEWCGDMVVHWRERRSFIGSVDVGPVGAAVAAVAALVYAIKATGIF